MRLLFVADGRSPIALNWIQHFVDQGHEVHLASTFACQPGLPLASLSVVNVAFSQAKGTSAGAADNRKGKGLLWGGATLGLRTALRQWLGPLTLPGAAQRLRALIACLQPDLVHAMRIPYEGMLAALAAPDSLLVVSVWGNDFTLHAPSTPWMARYTRLTLQRADGLHADCQRDVRLARVWGFAKDKPAWVLPGGGGVQLDVFHPPEAGRPLVPEVGSPVPTVINPRGMRAYVRNDTFFRAIPLVLQQQPDARFLCPSMEGEPQAKRWIDVLGIEANVSLLPQQTRSQMADLFRQAQIAVSPSVHDGTPNTLLEAMACGCFPVAGDIESIREWLIPGVNGLLVDPGNLQALAEAILLGLAQPGLREGAARHNTRLIAERAEYRRVMSAADAFYKTLVKWKGG